MRSAWRGGLLALVGAMSVLYAVIAPASLESAPSRRPPLVVLHFDTIGDTIPPDTFPPDDPIIEGGDSSAVNDSTGFDGADDAPDWSITPPPSGSFESGPDFSEPISFLRDQAMGVIKGCDYQKYLLLADSLASAMENFRSLEGLLPGRRWAVPFLDPISMLFRGAGVMATRKTAQAAHTSLAYQLEQVCNAVVQADQVSRQFELLKASARNIETNVRWLLNELELGVARIPGSDRAYLQANWKRFYTAAAPTTASAADTLWEAVDSTLTSTLSASQDMLAALDTIALRLKDTEREMFLFAHPDPDDPTRLWCPDAYPDPNAPEAVRVEEEVVCGPATPERQAQITAHLEYLKTQIRAMQLSADSRALQIESVRLMADNEIRRVTSLNRNASLLTF